MTLTATVQNKQGNKLFKTEINPALRQESFATAFPASAVLQEDQPEKLYTIPQWLISRVKWSTCQSKDQLFPSFTLCRVGSHICFYFPYKNKVLLFSVLTSISEIVKLWEGELECILAHALATELFTYFQLQDLYHRLWCVNQKELRMTLRSQDELTLREKKSFHL